MIFVFFALFCFNNVDSFLPVERQFLQQGIICQGRRYTGQELRKKNLVLEAKSKEKKKFDQLDEFLESSFDFSELQGVKFLSLENLNIGSSAETYEEYWFDPRIHTFGNTGPLGALHASLAPFATKVIDQFAYGGRNVRKEVIETFPDDALIFDFGCGTGTSTPKGSVGIDTSPEMLAAAEVYYPGRRYILGNIESFGEDNSCDIVLISFVFHEMPFAARKKVFENACRVAKKKVVVVDISKDYCPSETMLMGEPYVLCHLENTEEYLTQQGCIVESLVEGHVNAFTYNLNKI